MNVNFVKYMVYIAANFLKFDLMLCQDIMNVAVKTFARIVCTANKIQCGTSYLQLKDEIYPIMNILCRIFKVESRRHPRFLLAYI